MKDGILIGISGWAYPRWRKVFYPKGLAIKNELFFASRLFHTIEINGSFYRLQNPSVYRSWYDQTPRDFIFAVKGSRFITHMKKFKEFERPLANFFASGLLELKEKLGPILWQLPPNLKFDSKHFESFLQKLPRDHFEAFELAHQHDARVKSFEDQHHPSLNHPLRYAFEVRHQSFQNAEFVELLREYGDALVFADTGGRFPYFEDLTTDFAYVRLHGDEELYASGYDSEALDWWASRIQQWTKGKTNAESLTVAEPMKPSSKKVFVYFDNDARVRAPFDALDLSRKLGLLKDHSQEMAEERASLELRG
jgi:uncharacterized protein YecE (DUF72 family)